MPTVRGGHGSVTVTLAVPEAPEDIVARMVALPAATPVASPDELTVATAAFVLDQVKLVDGIVAPVASRAVNCCVWPIGNDAVAGSSVTGLATVIAAVPLLPSDSAVIVAL